MLRIIRAPARISGGGGSPKSGHWRNLCCFFLKIASLKKIIELLYLICKTRLEESKEEIEEIKDENGKENCYSCEQCDNWYENREDLEDHIRRRHTK